MKHRFFHMILSLALVIALLCGAMPGALAAGQAETPAGHRFGVRTAEALRAEAGQTLEAWQGRLAAAREDGLKQPLTEADLLAANAAAQIDRADGRVYMVRGAKALGAVPDAASAVRAVWRLAGLLSIAPDADLRLWSAVDINDTRVYALQQVKGGRTVLGSVVKLTVGPDGLADAVISGLAQDTKDIEDVATVSAAQAEELVRAAMADRQTPVTVRSGETVPAVLPAVFDPDAEDAEPDRLAWIVYTDNPQYSLTDGGHLPYLAHYVDARGEVLYSCEIVACGDAASKAGKPTAYAFEGMESDVWITTVQDGDGAETEVTVPVMRDTRTGVWYLADPNRKIAVADFTPMIYEDQRAAFRAASENGGWDMQEVRTYLNMIRVWDYYAAMGWRGADGAGTPILLLQDMCYENGEPVDNAAYIGLIDGWQCFGFGRETPFGDALDVLAHEFTHCVTTTTMNTNLYEADYGAINEAMSDIMGNICEFALTGAEDAYWLIGESLGEAIRAMAEPHTFEQPEYVWDLYYAPAANQPNEVNDRGGVHGNSSILNRVAARLCLDAGMSLDEASAFWLTVAGGMTALTDYPQMIPLLTWALEASGNGKYQDALARLIAESRMDVTAVPETLPEDRQLVTLTMPDTEVMNDPNWLMYVMQVNTEEIGSILRDMWALLLAPAPSGDADGREAMMEIAESNTLSEALRVLLSEEMTDDEKRTALQKVGKELFSSQMTWVADENGVMMAVLKRQPAVYMLMNFDVEAEEMCGFCVLAGDYWIDLTALFSEDDLGSQLGSTLKLLTALPSMLVSAASGESRLTLPTAGLENVTLLRTETEEEAETVTQLP